MSDIPGQAGRPRPTLSVFDAASVLVGVVIGAGIFAFPSLVAMNVSSPAMFIGAWVLGGVVSLIGALCYAELASAYPDAGGEYHFLGRAYGAPPAFLFAWARMTVIQTGSIALQAFVIGEYASQVWSLGTYSTAIYAAVVVVLLTSLNIAGLKEGKWTQNLLTACVVIGLLSVAGAGFLAPAAAAPAAAPAADDGPGWAAFGMAMVFVLLTYGGWNETSYLSAEIRGGRRRIMHVLVLGIGVVTAIYLIANVAFLRGLGFEGLAGSRAPAADLLNAAVGPAGAKLISLVVVVAALSTVNATILTGARTNYAVGRDFPLFGALGRWTARADAPRNALLLQGAISVALVAAGAFSRQGIQTMADYTVPVFWVFFMLTAASLIVLRIRDPHAERPFRVPLYPVTPILFCGVCGYMLYSGIAYAVSQPYAGWGTFAGLGVLLLGTPLMLVARARPGQRAGGRFEPVMPAAPARAAAGTEQA
jgi:amino acid transporter